MTAGQSLELFRHFVVDSDSDCPNAEFIGTKNAVATTVTQHRSRLRCLMDEAFHKLRSQTTRSTPRHQSCQCSFTTSTRGVPATFCHRFELAWIADVLCSEPLAMPRSQG